MEIKGFVGEYSFLSNFSPAYFEWRARDWETAEHAYQAAKCIKQHDVYKIHGCSGPRQAKLIGKRVLMRSDWEKVKRGIMKQIVFAKFDQDELLKNKLLHTKDAYLEETNDTYWGVCDGVGRNELGKILMEVREELIGL